MRHIVLLIILTSASFLQADEFDNIIINEFIALNVHVDLALDNKDFEDWIELYNIGENSVHLGDLYLIDDLDMPLKWKIPFHSHATFPTLFNCACRGHDDSYRIQYTCP